MPKPRLYPGKGLIHFCQEHGFSIGGQKGSHVNLVRIVSGKKQVITIPDHKEMDNGTLNSITKQLMKFITEKELDGFVYTFNN